MLVMALYPTFSILPCPGSMSYLCSYFIGKRKIERKRKMKRRKKKHILLNSPLQNRSVSPWSKIYKDQYPSASEG